MVSLRSGEQSMACFHCGSSLPSVSPKIKLKNRPHQLDLIETSPNHRLTLLDWTAQLSAGNNNLVRKLSSRNASISNLYQILGLFFVFEGVIISAVAQAGINCRNSWIIFTLSIIASVATLCACIQKLKEFAEADKSYSEEKKICSALNASIQELKEKGPAFNIVDGQPTVAGVDQNLDSPGLRGFCKKWVWSYAGAMVAVVLAFSGVTLVAVHMILCHQ